MKKLLLSIFILISVVSFGQKVKLAHVDALVILQELAVKDSVQSQIEYQASYLRAQLEKLQSDFNRDLVEYQSQMDSLAPMMRQMKEQQLQQRNAELQQKPQEFEQMIQQTQMQLTQPLEQKIKDAIGKVAKANAYTYILEKSQILYSDGGTDISNLVRKELGLPEPKAEAVATGK